MLGAFSSVEIQRWNLLRPGFTLTSGPAALSLADGWVVLQFWRINLISRADASRTLGFRSVRVAAI
jgi:hypothetical protein